MARRSQAGITGSSLLPPSLGMMIARRRSESACRLARRELVLTFPSPRRGIFSCSLLFITRPRPRSTFFLYFFHCTFNSLSSTPPLSSGNRHENKARRDEAAFSRQRQGVAGRPDDRSSPRRGRLTRMSLIPPHSLNSLRSLPDFSLAHTRRWTLAGVTRAQPWRHGSRRLGFCRVPEAHPTWSPLRDVCHPLWENNKQTRMQSQLV